ncbi:SRPBCC family protein [Marinobacter halodurans]|uniref:SRPBCC family protein n=1 Tax=Marinobacter halodurans TaxID=2528979 RepID=A0ABY1ZQ72_9GAMM|nr:SRPBCC family protein [Marinobacter halodurans]TBW57930.1 SRPBCC family protein [Marinobacter halodurans]
MASYTIEIQEQYDLPKDRVFALFSDHNRLGGVLGAPIKRIKDSNQADPNGVGSVRRIGIGPLGLEETVIAFEQDALIEYTVTSASPIRNHLGRIRFNDVAGKTVVNYTIRFDDFIPFSGKVISAGLEQAIRRGMKKVPKLA